MITLKQWLETVDYRITEGSEYMWVCYGHNAYSLSSWDGDYDGSSFNIIFNTKTQEIYEVQAHDYRNNRAYRLINPLYRDSYDKEALGRGEIANQAWDDVNYVDLETDEDWLDKANAIFNGEHYDTRVSIQVEFSDEELLKYMTIAHQRDITFNQLIEQALIEAIEREKLTTE
jgi:hypothetical protein